MHRHARVPGFLAGAVAISMAVVFLPGTVPARATQDSPRLPMHAGLFRDIARRQNPIVVAIMTTSRVEIRSSEGEDALRRLFGLPPLEGSEVLRGLGSGFLIGPEGEILTNDHVVAGAQIIEVGLFDEERTTYHARLVGRDFLSDTAVIKLDRPPRNLPVAQLGDSDALEPGDWVMAIGNPFQLGHSVTVGVVSYQGRPLEVEDGHWQRMIQTDASINPGNSGGPLIDVHGHVVGMNSAILGEENGGNVGIGFAIPINVIKRLLPQLRAGKVTRGQIGVELRTSPLSAREAAALGVPAAGGAIVTAVDEDSQAARSGIGAGDIIVEFDGVEVTAGDALADRISSTAPGSQVTVAVVRDGRRHVLRVTVDELVTEGDAGEEPPVIDPPDLGLTLGNVSARAASRLGLPAEIDGALVFEIEAASPADRAGVEEGDLVRRVNRQTVHDADGTRQALDAIQPGYPAFLLIWRDGSEVLIQLQKD